MTTDARVLAARHLLAVRKATDSFPNFVQALNPDFVFAKFQLNLMHTLDKLEKRALLSPSGTPIHRLLITMPPRHSKSFLSTIHFPTYFLARNPRRYVLSTSYNADLAKTFGRQCRDLAVEPFIAQAFPDFEMSDDGRAANDWRTTSSGTYYATGVGGSTTGRAANLLILDDPIKSRAEAESALNRNRVWSYYVSALTTRKQPESDGSPPIEIVILTRWHPDDVAGRLMETKDWKDGLWHHINLPALTEKPSELEVEVCMLPPDDPRYLPREKLREAGSDKRYYHPLVQTALWPERFPVNDLLRRKALDPREFEALYQQNPYIQGGNILKAAWWRNFRPLETKLSTLIVAADTAFKANTYSDYSVLMLLGANDQGDLFIMDVIRERLEFPELKRRCIALNSVWRGRGLRGFYVEDRASGQSLIQELKKESGLAVIPYKVGHTDKVARVHAVAPIIEGGRVHIPESAPWLDEFLTECESFPASKHDDQVDALSMGLDVLSRLAISPNVLLNAPLDPANSLYAQFRPLTSESRLYPKALGDY